MEMGGEGRTLLFETKNDQFRWENSILKLNIQNSLMVGKHANFGVRST